MLDFLFPCGHKILYFVVKNEWSFGCKFQRFVFCCKKKKKRIAVWIQLWISYFAVKNEWPFGYHCKILYFAVPSGFKITLCIKLPASQNWFKPDSHLWSRRRSRSRRRRKHCVNICEASEAVKRALTQEHQNFLISCFTLCVKIDFASHLLHNFCNVNMCCATGKIIFMKQEEKEKSEVQNGRR